MALSCLEYLTGGEFAKSDSKIDQVTFSTPESGKWMDASCSLAVDSRASLLALPSLIGMPRATAIFLQQPQYGPLMSTTITVRTNSIF